ncbi:hypothetical protein Q8F55_007369 [Vanrija albida]|uniref:SMP-LTD domain-containing protein n=1 Tax=Vanrija albida TaxID=181172 RepID=A0ABR3PTC7_9TREE
MVRREISANPTSGSVNVHTDRRELEADINRKVDFFGVIEAFRDGKLPDNRQIESALDYAKGHSFVDVNKLSEDGQELISDVRDIIGTMLEMVQRNNGDELVQEAIWESEGLGGLEIHPDTKGSTKREKEKKELKSDADEAGKHLRVLFTLFATNGEVRKLLKDLGLLGRDLFANAATKAADASRPSKEQMSHVDEAAEKNTWVSPDGTKTGPNQTPTLNANLPGGGHVDYNPKENLRDAQVRDGEGNTSSAGQVADAYRQEKDKVKDAADQYAHGGSTSAGYNGSGQGRGVTDSNTAYHKNLPSAGELADGARQAEGQARATANDAERRGAGNVADDAVNGRGGLKAQFNKHVSKEDREKAERQYDNFKHDAQELLEEEFHEERREQFIYRLKKVLHEVQQHQDYNDAMSWLLEAGHKYEARAERDIQNEVKHSDATGGAVQGVFSKFATILERFANGRSLEPTRKSIDNLYDDAKKDPELKQFWRDVDQYVNNVLLEPGYVLEDDAAREGKDLEKRAKSYFQTGKYKDNWDALWNNFVTFTKGFHEDPLNRQFADDWKRLTKHLAYDGQGKLAVKPHLWNDIRHQILPSLIRHIGYFPIPRAEYTDEKIDLVIENLILSGPNLFPNIVTIENHNYFKFSPFDSIKDKSHHRFRIGLSQIQADIRNLRFAFRKKKGFPKMSDSGIADVVIARNGISVDIEIETIENRKDTVFKVRSVETSIDELSFKIRDAKHDLLYKFIKVVATGAIKKAISKGIEAGIRSGLEYLDGELVQIRAALDESKNDDEVTRTEAIKQLYKRKKAEAEKAADSVDVKANAAGAHGKINDGAAAGGEFHIVAKKEESVLPDLVQDSKHSIVNKIDVAEKKAHSGKSWHSPAFSITPQKSSSSSRGATAAAGGVNNRSAAAVHPASQAPTASSGASSGSQAYHRTADGSVAPNIPPAGAGIPSNSHSGAGVAAAAGAVGAAGAAGVGAAAYSQQQRAAGQQQHAPGQQQHAAGSAGAAGGVTASNGDHIQQPAQRSSNSDAQPGGFAKGVPALGSTQPSAGQYTTAQPSVGGQHAAGQAPIAGQYASGQPGVPGGLGNALDGTDTSGAAIAKADAVYDPSNLSDAARTLQADASRAFQSPVDAHIQQVGNQQQPQQPPVGGRI